MVKEEHYLNLYLDKVIFKFKYSTILSLSSDNIDAAKPFRKKIFEEFPVVDIDMTQGIDLDMDLNIEDIDPLNLIDNLIWIFKNMSQDKTVELTDSYLKITYEDGSFTDINMFLYEINLIIDALNEFAPIYPESLELKYNHLIFDKNLDELKEDINDKYFNNKLMKMIGEYNFSNYMSMLNFKDNSYNINIHYGLFDDFSDILNKQQYMFNITCAYKIISSVDEVFDVLKDMDKTMWKYYKTAIKPKFRKEMKERILEGNLPNQY